MLSYICNVKSILKSSPKMKRELAKSYIMNKQTLPNNHLSYYPYSELIPVDLVCKTMQLTFKVIIVAEKIFVSNLEGEGICVCLCAPFHKTHLE